VVVSSLVGLVKVLVVEASAVLGKAVVVLDANTDLSVLFSAWLIVAVAEVIVLPAEVVFPVSAEDFTSVTLGLLLLVDMVKD